jgi:hypothetical protein
MRTRARPHARAGGDRGQDLGTPLRRASVYLTRDQFQWLKRRAADEDRSVTAILEDALERYRAAVEKTR